MSEEILLRGSFITISLMFCLCLHIFNVHFFKSCMMFKCCHYGLRTYGIPILVLNIMHIF